MAATLYDPAGWLAGDPTTWPQPIPPATLYQPGMVWEMSGPGVVDGQTVATGDLLYAVHRPRLYGDGTYGSGRYGSTPAHDWTYADVRFIAWYSDLPPTDRPPAPYSGCRFGDTGWWVIIEAWFVSEPTRTYGQGTYGSGVYGGGRGDVGPRWVDITAGFTEVTMTRGTDDGAASVDALELVATWYDPHWSRLDTTTPGRYTRPFVGAPIRVSLYDPVWRWHPRATAEIETVTDPTIATSSGEPRFAVIEAFGPVMDLTRTLLRWQRPAEPAATRFAALLAAAGWRYGAADLVYPPDVALHADADPSDVKARDEIDRTALSAGWMFDTDRRGRPRLRVWPLELGPSVATVVDCEPAAGELVATMITFTADESQMLNLAQATNALDPPTVATADDPSSISLYGAHDATLGFPATGLAFVDQAAGDTLVRRVRDRYSLIVTHVEPLEADTLVDGAWLPVLADLDTGEHLTVTRHHPTPFTLDAIVVGINETITPDQFVATLSTTTTTHTT